MPDFVLIVYNHYLNPIILLHKGILLMNKNYFILTGIFIGVCIFLCGVIWFFLSELYAYREEYDQLAQQSSSHSSVIENLKARNESLSRISHLSINRASTVPDAIAFFSLVRQIAEANSINLFTMSTSGGNNSNKKDDVLQLKIDGNYYALARMFADLRKLSVPSKITRLNMKRNHNLPEELVDVDLTMKVMTEE